LSLLNPVPKFGVADLDYEFSFGSFEKSRLKLIFGYVQNHHSYLDSATPNYVLRDREFMKKYKSLHNTL
jgi:hypothetical protein